MQEIIDQNLTELFLTGVITYGAPALGLALMISALGVPLPGTLMVIAAGAFVRQGVIDLPSASLFGFAGAVLGDSLGFGIGRFASGWVGRVFGKRAVWQKALSTFRRRGGAAIYLTRFLLTPLAIPTNLIAGSTAYSFRRFLIYVGAGELTWLALFGTLGYAFGSQWELISEFVSNFSGFLVGLAAIAGGIYFLLRRKRKQRSTAAEA